MNRIRVSFVFIGYIMSSYIRISVSYCCNQLSVDRAAKGPSFTLRMINVFFSQLETQEPACLLGEAEVASADKNARGMTF